MGATYVKLSPEDRCLLQGINKKLCELTGTGFDGQLIQNGEPINEDNPIPIEFASGGDIATATKQDQQSAILSAIQNALPENLGQAIMNMSIPVTLASDQTDVPISATSLPLPSGAATEATNLDIFNSIQVIINQTSGSVDNSIVSPVLPYTIVSGTYRSYTIITSGDVMIDGVSVPSGSYLTWNGESNETGSSKVITTPGGGTVIILTQIKL